MRNKLQQDGTGTWRRSIEGKARDQKLQTSRLNSTLYRKHIYIPMMNIFIIQTDREDKSWGCKERGTQPVGLAGPPMT